jgi:hypothetical protein
MLRSIRGNDIPNAGFIQVFILIGMLNPDEGWMIGNKGILYYDHGEWESFDLPRQVAFSKMTPLKKGIARQNIRARTKNESNGRVRCYSK